MSEKEEIMGAWALAGHDSFSDEDYPIVGEYATQAEAERAAYVRMQAIETLQPSICSGGQMSVQDWVYVVRPDGSRYRY